MVAGASKHRPKLENRFFKGIWWGKDTTSGDSYIGIGGRVIKARTIRRQVMPYKYDQQLMDTINGTPWAAKPATYTPNFIVPSIPPEPKPETSDKNISTQEDKPAIRDAIRKEEKQQEKRQRTQASSTSQPSTTLPTPAFAPSYGQRVRPQEAQLQLHHHNVEQSMTASQGSESKQQASHREVDIEPPRSKARMNAVTVKLKNGKPVTTATCEIPWMQRSRKGYSSPSSEIIKVLIQRSWRKEWSRKWHQWSITESLRRSPSINPHLRSSTISSVRIVGLGYDENIKDEHDIYASKPLFAILRVILAIALAMNWMIKVGDISTAFLHAFVAPVTGISLRPPKEFYPQRNILWRLKKAMYGLRSSPKAWQDHLANILQKLGFIRLISEPNVFKHPQGTMLHHGLCGRSSLCRRAIGSQQDLWGYTETSSTSRDRHRAARQDHLIPWKEDHSSRKSHRHYLGKFLCSEHFGGIRVD